MVCFATTHETLHPPLEFAPHHQDPPVTPLTPQADISTQAHNPPLIAPARVRLAETDHVSKSKLDNHGVRQPVQARRSLPRTAFTPSLRHASVRADALPQSGPPRQSPLPRMRRGSPVKQQ